MKVRAGRAAPDRWLQHQIFPAIGGSRRME